MINNKNMIEDKNKIIENLKDANCNDSLIKRISSTKNRWKIKIIITT